jgi:methyltransferase (TIGR00027 family)
MKENAPSATAAVVLKALLFAASDAEHGAVVPPEARELSREIAHAVLGNPRLFLFAARQPQLRGMLRRVERLLNPGFVLHVAGRKALLDKLAREALDAGSLQLIVVGAGYDTLALRLAASCPGLTCFEVDHPSTQAVKRAAIPSGRVPANLFFLPADLSARSLRDVLSSDSRFDAQRSSLVVIEGVLMYLSAEDVRGVFQQMGSLFEGGLTCLFTFMDRGIDGGIEFRTAHPLVNRWLKTKGERFLWGIERERLPGYLGEIGFGSVTTYGSSELLSSVFAGSRQPPQLAEGELIGVARARG